MPRMSTDSLTFYRVIIRTRVDRPELRRSSLPQVAAGRVILFQRDVRSQNEALGYLDDVAAGGWDFISEYAASVEILSCYPGRSPRVFRARVDRERRPDGTVGPVAAAA